MQVFDVRSVINGKPRKIPVSDEMLMCYSEWKRTMNENTQDGRTEFDAFYAGYVLANPIVREQLLAEKKQELKEQRKAYAQAGSAI